MSSCSLMYCTRGNMALSTGTFTCVAVKGHEDTEGVDVYNCWYCSPSFADSLPRTLHCAIAGLDCVQQLGRKRCVIESVATVEKLATERGTYNAKLLT